MKNLIEFAKVFWIASSTSANCLMTLALVYAVMACDSTAIEQIETLWVGPILFSIVICYILRYLKGGKTDDSV